MRFTTTSKKANQMPRVSRNQDKAGLDLPRVPERNAAVPARKMNVGAQKCVTHRVRKFAGVVVVRSVASKNNRSEKKSRTWSSAIKIITKPRRQSIESSLAGLGFSSVTPESVTHFAMLPSEFMPDPVKPGVACGLTRVGPKRNSLDRIGRIQVFGQEAVDFRSRLLGEPGIQSIELMPAGCVLVDLVLKLLVRGLQRLDHVFDFQHVHIFIVGRRVDQQWCLQFFDIPGWRSAAVLINVFADRLANVIRSGEQIA